MLFMLPAALTFILAGICLALQGRSAPALDGYGPDPRLILAALFAWALGIGLALTTLYAFLGKLPKISGAPRRVSIVAYHLALWLVVGATLAVPHIREWIWLHQAQRSPEWRAPGIVAGGTLEEIESIYTQARRETKDPGQLNDAMKSAALDSYRVDVLAYLKSRGVRVAEPGQEDAWVKSVIQVLRASGGRKPQDTLAMVKWVLDEGMPQNFTLKGQAAAFSDVDFYFAAYKDIDSPATRELLRLLVAHGADTVGCDERAPVPCPVVYLSGKGMTPAVRYLLSQGANPNSTDPGGDDTALSAAIRGVNPETVKVLLAAGARLRFEEYANDLVKACEPMQGPDVEKSKAVLRVLHAANPSMSDGDLARYQGTFDNDEQRACVKRFMQGPAR